MESSDSDVDSKVLNRKRPLSSDKEGNSSILQSQKDKVPIKEDLNISSKESTPKMLNKSSRSKRVVSSDSSDNDNLEDDNSEIAIKNNIASSSSGYSSCSDLDSNPSSDLSDATSEEEYSSTNLNSSSLSKRGNHFKKEKVSPERCKTMKKIDKKAASKKKLKKKSVKKEVSKGKHSGGRSTRVKKEKTKTKRKVLDSQDECSSDEGETTAYVPRRDRDHKQILVAAILCRWWHALPDWPPPDTNYQELLKEKKFRLVNIDDWEDAPDFDENGYLKVFQLSNFPGVFRDCKGTAHDLRPVENKPCYSNLIKMDEDKLYKLLVTALENQIKTLESNSNDDSKLINELKRELVEAQTLLARRSLKKK